MTISNRRIIDGDGADFYPTPAWATQVLLDVETFEGTIWEPACGDGAMSKVIATRYPEVLSTDLYDRGYGVVGVDFLKTRTICVPNLAANIITNPPFNLAAQFALHAIDASTAKVALLLRLSFLEGAKRQNTLFKDHPPSRVWVFSERITFYPNGQRTGGTGTTAYGWFVWDDQPATPTELKWLPLGYKGKE